MRIDPYFYEQPKKEFVEDLKRPLHEEPPLNFGKGTLAEGLIDASGIYIREPFPENRELLLTAEEDFLRFTEICGIGGKRYPILFVKTETDDPESYEIEFSSEGAKVYTGDTEGARRAIYYIEGELTKNEGAFVTEGRIKKHAYIKDRITRGFFSPTNRPPLYGDELLDDIDYYPDEYLNRLAHSGTNGLWIYTSFKALIHSPYFNENKENCEKRLKKLTNVVDKCKRYGVKVFVFAIEPHGLTAEDPKICEELLSGVMHEGKSPICLRKPKARDYLVNTVRELFTRVPGLGGYIDITAGERLTSCPSLSSYKKCPRCSKYSRGENLALTANLIKEGIRLSGADAKFISWTYGHRYWDYPDVGEYVEKTDSDVIFMQNFEDRGYNEQLGKSRIAYDYWLSYKGPSELYNETAKVTKPLGKTLYAKMQVCCSHELATVPYIPVPGIIFDKYKSARELGTTGIMECWYFGNYPSIMSKCSGEMSFADDLCDKRRFLLDFAARNYGKSVAAKLVDAWEKFEEGYVNYPTSIMFSYYGPMHDGVVWELPLLPTNTPLPRSWQLTDPPCGDRIGECLFSGHTLSEAIVLSERMAEGFTEGLSALPLPESDEGYCIAKALQILFRSGLNILRYFDMRHDLGAESGEPYEIIAEMKKIISDEKKNSEEMIKLTRRDNRLGYHSEAEGFKFFEKKLRDRIEKLDLVLKNEFAEVEGRIFEGKHPLGFYYAEGANAYRLNGEVIPLADGRQVSACLSDDRIVYVIRSKKGETVQLGQEFKLGQPETAVAFCDAYDPYATIHPESCLVYRKGLRLDDGATSHQSVWGEEIERKLALYDHHMETDGEYIIHTVRAKIPEGVWDKKTAIRVRVVVGSCYLSPSDDPTVTLGKKAFSPDEFAFFLP